jgi:hypothetical protein
MTTSPCMVILHCIQGLHSGSKGSRGSVDPELPGGDAFSPRSVMRTKDFRSLDEKRAYYRLLRHLLSEKLQASYKEDQARPLPPRMVDLLKTLEHREPPETHKTPARS